MRGASKGHNPTWLQDDPSNLLATPIHFTFPRKSEYLPRCQFKIYVSGITNK